MNVQGWLKELTAERVGWFGAGLSAAAMCMVGYQFVVASALSGSLPGPQPSLTSIATRTPTPTRTPLPTFTPRPTNTPTPTRTPAPTRTPIPTHTPTLVSIGPDLLATMTVGDPARVVALVATTVTQTRDALRELEATSVPP